MTDISLIIVNYNGSGFIEGCLESIRKNFAEENGGVSYETIIIDNASSDASPGYLNAFCSENMSFRLIKNNINAGFGAASNIGAEQAKGSFLLFLNPDCRIMEVGIKDVIDFYRDKRDAGALGVKMLDSNGNLQLSCRSFPTLARQFYESYFCYRVFRSSRIFGSYFMTWWDHGSTREVDWLSGSFILVEKKIFEEAGGFDRDYFMYSEDTDLCMKFARKGRRNYYYPFYAVMHADAGIASRDMALREAEVWRSRRMYFKKNHTYIHALLFSFIYFTGIINRIIVFGLSAIFSAGSRKRVPMYFKALDIYYGRKEIGGNKVL